MGLEAVTELLDRLGTDAVDAQQILLGLANQIADRLDADLAELVGPALRHAQVVEQVQASLLGGVVWPLRVNEPSAPPNSS